jgi:hypothetical protein
VTFAAPMIVVLVALVSSPYTLLSCGDLPMRRE